jgi:predicted RNase H-like nuclease (RuvC/YqgF family)
LACFIFSCQAPEGEEIPVGLENLVRRSGGDGEAESNSEDSQPILDGEGAFTEELTSLRTQLEEEQAKRRTLEREKGELERELEESKVKNVTLHRRYQDATRAFEQERRVS